MTTTDRAGFVILISMRRACDRILGWPSARHRVIVEILFIRHTRSETVAGRARCLWLAEFFEDRFIGRLIAYDAQNGKEEGNSDWFLVEIMQPSAE